LQVGFFREVLRLKATVDRDEPCVVYRERLNGHNVRESDNYLRAGASVVTCAETTNTNFITNALIPAELPVFRLLTGRFSPIKVKFGMEIPNFTLIGPGVGVYGPLHNFYKIYKFHARPQST